MTLARRIAGQPRPRKLHRGGWNNYVPTLTQGGGNATKTVVQAYWRPVDGEISVTIVLAIDGPGTAVSNNPILVGLPVPAFDATGGPIVGVGRVFDASGPAAMRAIARLASTTTVDLEQTQNVTAVKLGQSGSNFTTFASGDTMQLHLRYRPA